jgi:hypothetical protein
MRAARTSASEVGGAGIEKEWRWLAPTVHTGRAKMPSVSLLVPCGPKPPEIGKRTEDKSPDSDPFGGGTRQGIMF